MTSNYIESEETTVVFFKTLNHNYFNFIVSVFGKLSLSSNIREIIVLEGNKLKTNIRHWKKYHRAGLNYVNIFNKMFINFYGR